MPRKAEEYCQVNEEVEEQDGALPEDWRGEEFNWEVHTIGHPCCHINVALLSPDDSQFASRDVSHRTAYTLDTCLDSIHNPSETNCGKMGQSQRIKSNSQSAT